MNISKDSDRDSREQRLYKARARLEGKLVRMPMGNGRCPLDDDEEDQNRMLYNAGDCPRNNFTECLKDLFDKDELPPEDEAHAARIRRQEFRQKFRGFYRSWIKNSENPDHWMKKEDIPKYLKFALYRPLMCESELHEFLIDLFINMNSDSWTEYDEEVNENQKYVLKGIHCGLITRHPSTVYERVIPKGHDRSQQPQTPWLGGGFNELETPSGKDVSESAWTSVQSASMKIQADIGKAIKDFRRGGSELGDIEAVIGGLLKATKFSVKKYVAMLKDPSWDTGELAAEIYVDTMLDDWENNSESEYPEDGEGDGGEPYDTLEEEIDDISNAITLFRRGRYTMKKTKAVIREILVPLKYCMADYVVMIKDRDLQARELAYFIYNDALEERGGDQGVDDDEDSQEESHAQSLDDSTAGTGKQRHVVMSGTPPKEWGDLKVNFSPESKLWAIYQDVLHGTVDVKKAPSFFRNVLNKPDMSTTELSFILDQNDIPSDMFFTWSQIVPGFSEGHSNPKHVKFEEKPVDNIFTPAHSRQSSAWADTAAKTDIEYPDTPPLDPKDEMPPLERTSVLDQYIDGNLTTKLLSRATQKLATEPIVGDCLYEDEEEAEVPKPWYENVSGTSDRYGGDEAEGQVLSCDSSSAACARNVCEAGEGKEAFQDMGARSSAEGIAVISTCPTNTKSTKSSEQPGASPNEEGCLTNVSQASLEEQVVEATLSSPVDVVSSCSLPPQPSAIPTTDNATAAQPMDLPKFNPSRSSSLMDPPPTPTKRTRIQRKRKNTCRFRLCGTFLKPAVCPHRRSEDDRGAEAQVCRQSEEAANIDIRTRSPDRGDTMDLYGLRMSTRIARKLALDYGLPRGYVETFIRSQTAERAAGKNALKISGVRFVPTLKRRRIFDSFEDPAFKSGKVEEEAIPFAGEDEDHEDFMESRVHSWGPVPDVAPEIRCKSCGHFPCFCRGRGRSPSPREFSRATSLSSGSSLVRNSSPIGPSALRMKIRSQTAEAFPQRGRQLTPTFSKSVLHGMSRSRRENAESEPISPRESTGNLLPSIARSPSPMEGVSRSVFGTAATSQPQTSPLTRVHPPNPGRPSTRDTLIRGDSAREVNCPPNVPATPNNQPTFRRSTTPSPMQTTTVGNTLMHRISEELGPRAPRRPNQMRSAKMREAVDRSRASEYGSGFGSIFVSDFVQESGRTRQNSDNQQAGARDRGCSGGRKKSLSLLTSSLASGSEAPRPKSSSTTVLNPTGRESNLNAKSITKAAGPLAWNLLKQVRKDCQVGPTKSTSSSIRLPSLSSVLETLNLDRTAAPVLSQPWGISINSNEAPDREGSEPVAPRNLSVSATLESLSIGNPHQEKINQSESIPTRIQSLHPPRMLPSVRTAKREQYESSVTCTPTRTEAPSGQNVAVEVRDLDGMDHEAVVNDSSSSTDFGLSTLTAAEPATVKIKDTAERNDGDQVHRSSFPFPPKPPFVPERDLADEMMNRSASPSSMSPQPPPAPRLANVVPNMGRVTLNMPLSCPPLAQDPPPSGDEHARNTLANNQRVLHSLSTMPQRSVQEVLDRIQNYLKRAEQSGRCHRGKAQPRPLRNVPRFPEKGKDDLYERAWDEKSSVYVYLWRGRQKRQLANRDRSLNRYFAGVPASAGKGSSAAPLNKLFDKYRGTVFPPPLYTRKAENSRQTTEDATHNPDIVGTTGTMQYLTELGVALDEPAVCAVLTELAAPTMGELGRDGFVQGWAAMKCETLQKQQASLSSIRKRLSEDLEFFRKVYKYTFRTYI